MFRLSIYLCANEIYEILLARVVPRLDVVFITVFFINLLSHKAFKTNVYLTLMLALPSTCYIDI